MTIGFGSSSSINGSDKMLGWESLSLIHVRSIKDGALRFFHVVREEEASHDLVFSDCELTLVMLPRVHRSPSYVFNLNCRYSSDEWLRLNRFKMNHHSIRVHRVPPYLSEDQLLQLSAWIEHFPLRHITCKDIKIKIVLHDKNKRDLTGT